MCSIAGIVNFLGHPVEKELLQSMSDKMILRGPDESGIYVNGNIGLAHRRLSIIDLNTGHQPMMIDDGNIVIVYNGEVYNYLQIKQELEKEGVSFKTKSDTEVVAWAYNYYGIEKCLEMIEGMYAFAIYDKRVKKVFVVRDRFGEKPLYYYNDDSSYYFASELKAFNPTLKKFSIDKTALNLFFTVLYIPAPYTIYQEIRKLEPGCYMEIDENCNMVINRYYDISSVVRNSNIDYETAKETVRNKLLESVKNRMVADVPMGAFLSGGIDSSIVCSIMAQQLTQPINTFSIGFEEKDYDESDRARLIAKHIGAHHTEYTLQFRDVLDILDDILLYYDEPYGGSSAIPSYYVAKLASRDVKLVLTGDCADELFGGYEKYLASYYIQKYKRIPCFIRKGFEHAVSLVPVNQYSNNVLRKINKVIRNANYSEFDLYYNMLANGFDDKSRRLLLKDDFFDDTKSIYLGWYQEIDDSLSYLQRQQLMDVKRVLEGQMFVKVDRACMHCSLENRAPFVDRKIVELALSLNDEYKICGKNKKRILKDSFADILPKETLEFSKRGFGVPVDHWLRQELRGDLLSLCSKEFIERQGFFNYEYIHDIIQKHISGKENNKNKLWNLYVFQKWYQKNTR